MTAYRFFAPVFISLALAACATAPDTMTADPDAITKVDQGETLVQLSSRNLQAGECALFLFTRDTPRRFVLFSRAASNQADLILDDEEITLPLTEAGGDIFGQFLTRQTFSNDKENIRLSLTPGDIIEDGQRIPVASLTRTMADGWDVITPLQGVRACQPDRTTS